jgi:speckle-type POZ protein
MESLSFPTSKAHLMDLFETGKYADITIKIKGKKDIRAHNNILSRSTVIDAMLNRNECKESRDKIIHIKDIEYEVIYEMIRFLYYDEIPRMKEMAVKLMIAADKYDVPKLVSECENYLLNNVGMENFSEVLVASHALNVPQLKNTAIDFVIDCRKEIFASDGWKALKESHNMLAWEVVEKFMSNA